MQLAIDKQLLDSFTNVSLLESKVASEAELIVSGC